MGRITTGWVAVVVGMTGVGVVVAQGHEPRGLTFGQGGGFRYAPREHHVNIYTGHHYGGYGYGWPAGFYGGHPAYAYGYGYGFPAFAAPGFDANWGYPVQYGTVVTPGYYWPEPLPMSQIVDSPLVAPRIALPANVTPWGDLPGPKADPAERPILPSSAAARLKSLDYQADGDQNVRQQLWQRAYINYRQAVNVADDQAAAHLRYGIVFAVLRRYDRAEMEFKRAVFIDPALPTSEFTLEKLFGPDSQLVRSSIISRIGDWVNEDIADPQRLFVMGVLLHFNQDDRAQELFSAAQQVTGGASHITAFLSRSAPPGNSVDPPPKPGGEATPQLPPAPLPAAPAPAAVPPPADPRRPATNLPQRFPPPPSSSGVVVDRGTAKERLQKASPEPQIKPAVPDGPVLLPPQ